MTAPVVIAEAGVNHNGDLGRARAMVAAAADAGADYVKFQAFSAETLVAKGARTAPYQAANAGVADQAELLAGLEIGMDGMAVLAEDCRKRSIGFLCTPFDLATARGLVALGMDRIKVASGELTNSESLAAFAGFGLPVILSTGMATLAEVEAAVTLLRAHGGADITLLHCTSLYPAPAQTLNLRAMVTMAKVFALPVGYSDHSLGDYAAVAAVALGARVIEKHFTLDRALPGPDHAASLEPDELAGLIGKLRLCAVALGDGDKHPAAGEVEIALLVRRSWHAARDLAPGTVLDDSDVALLRPADGLDPRARPVGRSLRRALAANEPIREDDLEAV